jgi:hypothetical protein
LTLTESRPILGERDGLIAPTIERLWWYFTTSPDLNVIFPELSIANRRIEL